MATEPTRTSRVKAVGKQTTSNRDAKRAVRGLEVAGNDPFANGSRPIAAQGVAAAYALMPARAEIIPFMDSRGEPRLSQGWVAIKRTIDFVGAVSLIATLSPVLAVICVMIARSGGNIIYGHPRLGRGGRWFTCYKFRTMVPNAEEVLKKVLADHPEKLAEWIRDEKLRDDPRITRIGAFLRKTSLDELPQLLNVVLGDMSLVGPRPVTDTGMSHYGKALRWYLAVRPGMTGLWQVSGRNDVGFRRRVVMDIYYVRAQSMKLDLQILLRTVKVVLGGTGY